MSRGTFVLRNGTLVPKDEAEPLRSRGPASGLARPYVIGDGMELRSMHDGQFYTSKAKYRAELRANGLTEIGNEKIGARRGPDLKPGGVKDDIRRSISELTA